MLGLTCLVVLGGSRYQMWFTDSGFIFNWGRAQGGAVVMWFDVINVYCALYVLFNPIYCCSKVYINDMTYSSACNIKIGIRKYAVRCFMNE